jgi:hypothetical protein
MKVSCINKLHKFCNVSLQFCKITVQAAAQTFEKLQENDTVSHKVWNGWSLSIVQNSGNRHICKMILNSDEIGENGDIVLKRFDIAKKIERLSSSSRLSIVQKYTIPTEYDLTGLIAFEDGNKPETDSDSGCGISVNQNEVEVTMIFSSNGEEKGLNFIILVIGKKNGIMVDENETNSNEQFKDYVY